MSFAAEYSANLRLAEQPGARLPDPPGVSMDRLQRVSDWELGSVIGIGGFSEVRKTRRVGTPGWYAFKGFKDDGDSFDQFETEVRALMQIKDSNVVEYADHGVVELPSGWRMPYVVTVMADEGSLYDYVKREKASQSTPRVRTIASTTMDTALGLTAIHSAGLIHRDIKPGNVLFHKGFAKVADLGNIVQNPHQDQGFMPGTHTYMAPEQLFGYVTDRSDTYAVALNALFMLRSSPWLISHPEHIQKVRTQKDHDEHIARAIDIATGERYDMLRKPLLGALRYNDTARPDTTLAFAEDIINNVLQKESEVPRGRRIFTPRTKR